jgi:hypothetical protein
VWRAIRANGVRFGFAQREPHQKTGAGLVSRSANGTVFPAPHCVAQLHRVCEYRSCIQATIETSFARHYAMVRGISMRGDAKHAKELNLTPFLLTPFLLAYNPTEGFWRDMLESAMDKLGRTSAISFQFADILGGVDC